MPDKRQAPSSRSNSGSKSPSSSSRQHSPSGKNRRKRREIESSVNNNRSNAMEVETNASRAMEENRNTVNSYSPENVTMGYPTKDDIKKGRQIRKDVSDENRVFGSTPNSRSRFKQGRGNIGFAKYNINNIDEGNDKFLLSASGREPIDTIDTSEPYAPYVDNDYRKLKAQKIDEDMDVRDGDTEAKILEELLNMTSPDDEGEIRLFTERNVCISCDKIINEFAKERHKIDIEVVVGKNYDGSPIPDD